MLFPFIPEISVITVSVMIGLIFTPTLSFLPAIVYDLLYMPASSRLPYMTLYWIGCVVAYYVFIFLRKRLVRW